MNLRVFLFIQDGGFRMVTLFQTQKGCSKDCALEHPFDIILLVY